jgi:serine/threonine protein kinase
MSTRRGYYQLEEKIGQGGFAEVWRATDLRDQRTVAIKRVRASANPSIVERLIKESQWIQQLTHPNIVHSYGVLQEDGETCLVIELCQGSISDFVRRRGPLPVLTATKVAIQALQGLAAAHQKHIVHRDIKPENLLISFDGTIKVADFGISTLFDDQASLSRTGGVLGSVPFMAPEQRQGLPTAPQTDLYALAATLVWMCTAELPGDLYVAAVQERLSYRLPRPLCDVLEKAGAYGLQERYASAEQLRLALEEIIPLLPSEETSLEASPTKLWSVDTASSPQYSLAPIVARALPSSSPWLLVTLAVATLGCLAAAVGVYLQFRQQQSPIASTTQPVVPAASLPFRKIAAVPLCEDAPLLFNSTRVQGPRETVNAAAADLNNDGFDELIFTNQYDENLSIYDVKKDALLTPSLLPFARSSEATAIADLNKDGYLDILGAHPDQANLTLHYGKGGLQFSKPRNIMQDGQPRAPRLIDWNGDGSLDILVQRGTAGLASVEDCLTYIKNLGSESFAPHQCIGYPLGAPVILLPTHRVYSVEDDSIVRRDKQANLLLGPAETVFPKEYFVDARPLRLFPYDLNQDGVDELYVSFFGVYHAIMRFNEEKPEKSCLVAYNAPIINHALVITDFNRDGLFDYAAATTCSFCVSNHYLQIGMKK